MISFLLLGSSFLNFVFYIYAIGFVVALVLEQFVKDNERKTFTLFNTIENICGGKLGLLILIGSYVILDYIFYQEICNLWVILSGMVHYEEERRTKVCGESRRIVP